MAGQQIYRHRWWVRVTHWVNLVCMTVLLMSGLQIFNAHPALYWGDKSRFADPIFAIGAERTAQGRPIGVTTIAGHDFNTTGVLGLSGNPAEYDEQAFPAWATLGQWLAMGRRWHFFFAWLFVVNGAIYGFAALLTRHFSRDLVPWGSDLRAVPHSILDHLRLRFPKGAAAKRYNVLQKLAYLVILCGIGPLAVLAGLSMSPRIDASYPWLLDFFGGRQSARTIHFICAFSLLGFTAIHVAMVILSGPLTNLRAMVTGWYDVGRDKT